MHLENGENLIVLPSSLANKLCDAKHVTEFHWFFFTVYQISVLIFYDIDLIREDTDFLSEHLSKFWGQSQKNLRSVDIALL